MSGFSPGCHSQQPSAESVKNLETGYTEAYTDRVDTTEKTSVTSRQRGAHARQEEGAEFLTALTSDSSPAEMPVSGHGISDAAEKERALLSWEQALDSGLRKIKRTSSELSSHLKPPPSLFEPKLSRVQYSWLPSAEESDIGPSASVMAYLTERYRRERMQNKSAVSAASTDYSASSGSLTSSQLRSAIDKLSLEKQGSSSSRLTSGRNTASPQEAVVGEKGKNHQPELLHTAQLVQHGAATTSSSACSSSARSWTEQSLSAAAAARMKNRVDGNLERQLQKVALLEGPRRGRRPGSASYSASQLKPLRPVSVDLLGVARGDDQEDDVIRARHEIDAPVIKPAARPPNHNHQAQPDGGARDCGDGARKQQVHWTPRRSDADEPRHLEVVGAAHDHNDSSDGLPPQQRAAARARALSGPGDPATTRARRSSLKQAASLIQSDAAVLGRRGGNRKSRDLGFRGKRPAVAGNAGRHLKEEVRRDIMIQDWMGLIQPRDSRGSQSSRC
ncbi:unnamed protein product [Amoebophrya sp. A120]|nr:unnamed protein product [Amoebophrya sp. A120]CAD7975512.1 unnamed protein product [Amoebophrya sp. A120]|eukprot:GSA120T00002177001.1